jgi:hypothetical protein
VQCRVIGKATAVMVIRNQTGAFVLTNRLRQEDRGREKSGSHRSPPENTKTV